MIEKKEEIICPECFKDMKLNRKEEQYECQNPHCGYTMWTWI